jgi:L-arabinose isomerase
MKNPFENIEIWFVTGSQHLYGPGPLQQVQENTNAVVAGLASQGNLPLKLVSKPIVTTSEQITALCREANAAPECVGLVFWMHTFSPARMWMRGLKELQKPFLHLHTQFNRDIPWSTIDMDFMNLNQAAHGDREFGYICTRLGKQREVVVGHWQDAKVQSKIGSWMRVTAAWHDHQNLLVARIGDNMRNVAVTEGDKIEAQIRFGYTVNGYGIGEVTSRLEGVSDADIQSLCHIYDEEYTLAPALAAKGARREELEAAARIELALRSFLLETGAMAFTDTFENLHGLRQLPGIAAQRLMADGYGFGAEGDWKHAALVRAIKVMGYGIGGGTSFMEDYTYHLHPDGGKVLGAHMLEICPSIAGNQPTCEIHPLGIGGKEDPVRLVFTAHAGQALNATVIDTGTGFKMIVNPVEVETPPESLPNLPVARALWTPLPDLERAAESWIQAGGAHHTAFSYDVTPKQLQAFARLADVGFELIS